VNTASVNHNGRLFIERLVSIHAAACFRVNVFICLSNAFSLQHSLTNASSHGFVEPTRLLSSIRQTPSSASSLRFIVSVRTRDMFIGRLLAAPASAPTAIPALHTHIRHKLRIRHNQDQLHHHLATGQAHSTHLQIDGFAVGAPWSSHNRAHSQKDVPSAVSSSATTNCISTTSIKTVQGATYRQRQHAKILFTARGAGVIATSMVLSRLRRHEGWVLLARLLSPGP
jgi:hypothetical protein